MRGLHRLVVLVMTMFGSRVTSIGMFFLPLGLLVLNIELTKPKMFEPRSSNNNKPPKTLALNPKPYLDPKSMQNNSLYGSWAISLHTFGVCFKY